MRSIFRAAELGVCIAWVATAPSCARQSVPANDGTTRPSLGAEWVAYKDGCNLYSYEYYGRNRFKHACAAARRVLAVGRPAYGGGR
jgi:hypothetical protein